MTNIYITLLIFMIFAHIVDDFYLQGCLANMKQKSWWEKNAPDPLYKRDYIISLIIHGLSWAIVTMLPIIVFALFKGFDLGWFYIIIPVNAALHACIDHLKANLHTIDLVADQTMHAMQILATLICFILTFKDILSEVI